MSTYGAYRLMARAMRNSMNSRVIGANAPMKEIMNHKSVAEHVMNGTRHQIGQSQTGVLNYMNTAERGGTFANLLSAGSEKGQAGLAQMIGGFNRYKGGTQLLAGRGKSVAQDIETLKGYGSGGEEMIARRQAELKNVKGAMWSPGRAAGAARDMGVGGFKYMNSGTMAQRAAKFGALGVGIAGVGGAGRVATGRGSMFYNKNGEQDIAGIPFI